MSSTPPQRSSRKLLTKRKGRAVPRPVDVISRLFPYGTNVHAKGSCNQFPRWPPDLFAAAAKLISLAECYCRPRYTCGHDDDAHFSSEREMSGLAEIAEKLASFENLDGGSRPIRRVQSLWQTLLNPKCGDVTDDTHPLTTSWWDAAMKLLIIADSASSGVGFVNPDPEETPLADFVLNQMMLNMDDLNEHLPYLPVSICRLVPPEEACVQPKTRTSQNGCTIRSLTHHLALLPSAGEVVTSWLYGMSYERLKENYAQPLNLLVVPFPYRIDGKSFLAGRRCMSVSTGIDEREKRRWQFFDVQQRWLQDGKNALTAKQLTDFLLQLLERAEHEVGCIDGIVLPELALDERRAKLIVGTLARKKPTMQIFISGIATRPTKDEPLPKNCAFASLLSDSKVLTSWKQSKHHRWKLDHDQICRYHLGDRLRPSDIWWEHINIEERQCAFWVIRPGMSVVALVCEDLARIDPVQTVIRSIGPNLVIALLMDGPQLERRWSGRYATVLADDPGSAVLTVTSLGMIKRSVMPGENEPRQIALWKGPNGPTRELSLPKNAHALLLTLSVTEETNFTFDGRSDGGATFGLDLAGVRPIRAGAPPDWAEVD